MSCIPSDYSYQGVRTDNTRFVNWLGNVNNVVDSMFLPSNRLDLVFIAREAHELRLQLRVKGTGWSFENICASNNWMIDMSQINQVLNTFSNAAGTAASPLTRNWQNRILEINGDDRLVHVESGITIFDLNTRLDALQMAMPTLGGSQGQTLAGAINTGTHGGNPGQPPLADLVQAVHLITNEGKELWIESDITPITVGEHIKELLGCDEIEVVRNDQLLKAVQVSVGRFGIIYSYVMKVRRRYNLMEVSVPAPWSEVSALLREGLAEGSFTNPLIRRFPRPDMPQFFNLHLPEHSEYLELLYNSRNGDAGYLRRRWEMNISLEEEGNPRSSSTNILDDPHAASAALKVVASALRLYSQAIFHSIPGYGWIKGPIIEGLAAGLDFEALHMNMKASDMVVKAMNAIWEADDLGALGWLLNEVTNMVFHGRPEITRTPILGASWHIMVGNGPANPDDPKVNSIEIIFDALQPNYIDFLDFIFQYGRDFRQSGYVSVRYSKSSKALLSMHNFGNDGVSVAIEVASLVGFNHNARWMQELEQHGVALGGRPHWGQQNNLTRGQVQTLYGEQINQWRQELTNIVYGSETYRNAYTFQRGLEPTIIDYIVTGVSRNEYHEITHLCNPEAAWRRMSVDMVMNSIEMARNCRFIVDRPGNIIPPVRIILVKNIGTFPDDSVTNNLQSLPESTTNYDASPPPFYDRDDRQITSVTRNSSGAVIFLSNDIEQWTVSKEEVYNGLRSGVIRYFLLLDGIRNDIIVLRYLATERDGITENNLSSLPTVI